MNENYCSEILDKSISERHIEEASDAEAFFKARKSAALRRSRILKSVSVFAACVALVLSLSVAAMFTGSDNKSEDAEKGYSDLDCEAGDSPADKEDDDFDGIHDGDSDEGKFDGESEEVAGLTGVYAINIGSFEENIGDSLPHDILSLEAKGTSVTITSKQKTTLEKQLKVYLKEFCEANSLGEEYSFEISSIGKEFSAHIFARAFVTLGSGQTIELLIVTAK